MLTLSIKNRTKSDYQKVKLIYKRKHFTIFQLKQEPAGLTVRKRYVLDHLKTIKTKKSNSVLVNGITLMPLNNNNGQ